MGLFQFWPSFTVLSGALFFYWVYFSVLIKQFSNYSSQGYGIVEVEMERTHSWSSLSPCHWSLTYHNTMSTNFVEWGFKCPQRFLWGAYSINLILLTINKNSQCLSKLSLSYFSFYFFLMVVRVLKPFLFWDFTFQRSVDLRFCSVP